MLKSLFDLGIQIKVVKFIYLEINWLRINLENKYERLLTIEKYLYLCSPK
jgi:hypothetical protein